jgi:hypothetical protein
MGKLEIQTKTFFCLVQNPKSENLGNPNKNPGNLKENPEIQRKKE